MFIISFSTNLIKRHPKCMRLIHRRSTAVQSNLERDPFREDQEDPMDTRAIKSSLWELETIMRQHVDSSVRTYAKVFKTDFLRKTAFFKCEDFTSVDPIDMLLQELDEVNHEKEGEALKKNLLQKHGQSSFTDKLVGMKRHSEIDAEFNDMLDRSNAPKRAKFAENFEDVSEMFALHH